MGTTGGFSIASRREYADFQEALENILEFSYGFGTAVTLQLEDLGKYLTILKLFQWVKELNNLT
jgi:hypothetical protein